VRLIAALMGLVAFSAGALAETPPTSDDFAAAQALLRWYLPGHKPSRRASKSLFVCVAGAELPQQVVRALQDDTGRQFRPCGEYETTEPEGTIGGNLSIVIGKPEQRSDGDFDVTWNYYCGGLCGGSSMAILRRDASGWHVVKFEERLIQ
jgi:hypothetical protein